MSGGTYDFVVMGGGHNGLLSSIYLAKAGYKVCVLEALDEFGGGTRSGEIAPGYIADQGGMVHNLISRTPIVREDELELFSKYGLEYKFVDSLCCSIFPNEEHLILYSDLDKTCEQIAKFSERDAETYREFVNYFLKLSGAAAAGTAGAIPAYGPMMNVLAMSPEGREFIRVMNSSAQQIVEEWFESEEVRVTLTRWCTEMMIDPRQVGTAAGLLRGFARAGQSGRSVPRWRLRQLRERAHRLRSRSRCRSVHQRVGQRAGCGGRRSQARSHQVWR